VGHARCPAAQPEVVLVNSKRASAHIPMRPDALFEWLCTVENWPRFVDGLDAVEKIGHRRYRWSVRYAKHARTVDVVMSVDAHQHRIAWKHLNGGSFDGTLRVTPLGDTRSQVDLALDIEPEGFVEGVVDAFGTTGTSGWMAQRDLQKLQDLVTSGAISSADKV
jgi:uncharacterized membrane protein